MFGLLFLVKAASVTFKLPFLCVRSADVCNPVSFE